ncbi:MAG: cell wall-binding repeat-containing protein [Chloroflexota bacterium]|nr:cell wall-binding repeat-containing protein [Chloroflexota bacterium]
MRDRFGAAVIAAITLSMAVLVAAPAPTSAATLKVAIIVGPVGGLTSTYRSYANEVATAATAAGATVAKAYSPSATWTNVKNAVSGANVIVYFGHGNGYPNPYGSTELTDRSNGWGLNRTTSNGDSDNWSTTMVYCGERVLLGTLTSSDDATRRTYCGGTANDGIAPAPGFTMVYAQAHYAPGFGERYTMDAPLTTLSEAQQRVRHYSTPILRLGGTFLATAYGDADEIVTRVLEQRSSSFRDIFRAGRGYSATTLTDSAHADISGTRVWVQRTSISGLHFGQPDYWYAFAGDPMRTPGGATVPPADDGPILERWAGRDRYATAAAVSAASFAPGTAVAYVATGSNFPDALAAGAAAARYDGPVLLVSATAIPSATATELARLRPGSIKVIGGTSVVSSGVEDALRQYAASGNVERVGGANRYATAARVSADAFAAGAPVAYVATGNAFPDALTGVAAAGSDAGPMLLVGSTGIPSETASELTRLRPGRIVVLGGTSVISSAVATSLARYATSGSVTRLAGSDRYGTAAAVSRGTFDPGPTVFVATGVNFPDAVGGGPVAGGLPGPLLLVSGSSVPATIGTELQRLDPATVVILGGTSAVSETVVSQIRSLLTD